MDDHHKRKQRLAEELEWVTTHASRRTPKVEIYRMILVATIYYVSQARNNIIFKKTRHKAEDIIRQCIQEVQ